VLRESVRGNVRENVRGNVRAISGGASDGGKVGPGSAKTFLPSCIPKFIFVIVKSENIFLKGI